MTAGVDSAPGRSLVSIVLPTHNGASMVRRAIESCLEQTHESFELIVVDDASTDGTSEILAGYKDPRIVVIRNETQRGLPASLNRGFEAARGELLTWTSDDNWYRHTALERLVGTLQANPETDIVYADHTRLHEDARHEPCRVKLVDQLALENVVQACFMYRRSVMQAVGPYDEALECAEDYDFWLRARAAGMRFAPLHEDLYVYRMHAGSLTGTRRADVLSGTIATQARHLDRLPGLPRRMRAQGHRQIAEQARELGDQRTFRRHFLKALFSAPSVTLTRQYSGRFPLLNFFSLVFGFTATDALRRAYHRIARNQGSGLPRGTIIDSNVPRVVIRPKRGWALLDLREVWRYRELMWVLALRDIKVRYKQSVIGIAWALIQPLLTMIVFTLLFTLLGRYPTTGDVPYAVALYTAMLPWQMFANSLSQSGESLISDRQLITKVYFPRVVVPLAPIVGSLVDFCIAFTLLLAMIGGARAIGYEVFPSLAIVTVPVFVFMAALASLALGLWLSALNALYRDFRYVLPFMLQLGLIASPVLYDFEFLAEKLADKGWSPMWLHAYALNPMVSVLEGFRWALLGKAAPPLAPTLISLTATLALLAGGLVYFRRMERSFADRV